jgi:hypothetical protein
MMPVRVMMQVMNLVEEKSHRFFILKPHREEFCKPSPKRFMLESVLQTRIYTLWNRIKLRKSWANTASACSAVTAVLSLII